MFIQVVDDDGDVYTFPMDTVKLHTCDLRSCYPKWFINGHRVTPDFYDKILKKIEEIGIISE